MTTIEKSKAAKRVYSNRLVDKMHGSNVVEAYAPLTNCTSYYAERQNLVASMMNKTEICKENEESCICAVNKKTRSAPEVYLTSSNEITGNDYSTEDDTCDDQTDAALSGTCTHLCGINLKGEEQSAACNVHVTRMRHEPYAVSLLKPEDSLYSANLTHVTFKPTQHTFISKSNESNTLQSSSVDASCTVNADNKNRVINNEVSKKSRSNRSYENSLNSPFENARCTSEGNVSRYQQYINFPAWFQVSEANHSTYNKCKKNGMHLASYAVRDERQNSSEIIAADENEQLSKTYSNENIINVLLFHNNNDSVDVKDVNDNSNIDEQECNTCNLTELNPYNNTSKCKECWSLNNNQTHCNTSLEMNNLQTYYNHNYKADADRNEYKHYNDAVLEVNKSHITNVQSCFIEPITLPPSRYQIQRELQLASINAPMTNASSVKSTYYTENGVIKHSNNTVDNMNNNNNDNQFSASRQSSDMAYHVYVDDAPSRRISHEYDCPLNTRQGVNIECNYVNHTHSNHHYQHEQQEDEEQHHYHTMSDSFNSNSDHYEARPVSALRLSEELSASTSAERTARTLATTTTTTTIKSSSLSPETSPELVTEYSPFVSSERSAAKLVDSIPMKSSSGVSSFSMHVSDNHINNSKTYYVHEQKDTVNTNCTKCVTTPIKNLSKIYVSGRPLPVRRNTQLRRQVVEVKVNLRHCEDDFLITDLHSMFGPHIKLTDLIGRYVLVEGDRGIDMGQITAVLKTNVVAHGDISQLGNFDLNYMESQDGSFHINTTSQPHASVHVDDNEANNGYTNDNIDNSNEDNDNINNNNNSSFGLKLSTSRNSTSEVHEFAMMPQSKEEIDQTHEQHDNMLYNDGTEEQEGDMYPSLDHLPVPTAEEILQEQFMPRVLREATCHDEEEMMTLTHDEVEARNYCEECLQRIHLPVAINIEDVLFQFDRKKLIVRYTSNAYVDFNVLTRTLHNRYKCRIWMDQVNRDACEGVHDRKRHGNMHNNNNNTTNYNNYNSSNGKSYNNNNNNNNTRRNYNYSAERSGNNNYEHRNCFSNERADNNNNNNSYHHNHHSRTYYNNNNSNNNNNNNTRYPTRRRPLRRNTRTDEESDGTIY